MPCPVRRLDDAIVASSIRVVSTENSADDDIGLQTATVRSWRNRAFNLACGCSMHAALQKSAQRSSANK